MNGYRKMEYSNLWFLKASFLLECFVHNIVFIEAGLPGDVTAPAMKTGKGAIIFYREGGGVCL